MKSFTVNIKILQNKLTVYTTIYKQIFNCIQLYTDKLYVQNI